MEETKPNCGNRRTNEHSRCRLTDLGDGKAVDNGKYAYRDHDGEVVDIRFDREIIKKENEVAEEEELIRCYAPKGPLLEQPRSSMAYSSRKISQRNRAMQMAN